mgnify:CR=1 FL=1
MNKQKRDNCFKKNYFIKELFEMNPESNNRFKLLKELKECEESLKYHIYKKAECEFYKKKSIQYLNINEETDDSERRDLRIQLSNANLGLNESIPKIKELTSKINRIKWNLRF